jgi:DNA-binding transcriptional MerR regulator
MAKIDIPEQLTFRRREVMQLTKLDGRVLDYWETEFAAFVPVVNQSGEKYYSRHDVEIILRIRELLVVDKRDKESVRQLLQPGVETFAEKKPAERGKKEKVKPPVAPVCEIRRQLKEILTLLDKDDKK